MLGSKLLNRYEILRELGRGGMGVVYLAHDPVLEREVAVKLVTPDNISAESVERFKREARVVAKMDHPSIVSVHDSGEHEGSLFFVMPLVDGTNLRSLLKSGTVRLGDLVDIGVQIAEALDYSHSRGIIHRDIKPENIMITRDDAHGIRVRVTDFGLAMGPSHERITRTATVVGTVAYMSPEQVTGREIDSRTDIYSFGTVLYECLVGQTPFSGEVQSVLYRIAHEIPMPPRALQADIDEDLQDIVMRCLEKDPAKRPGGREVVQSLVSYKIKLQNSARHQTVLPSSTTLSFQYQRPVLRPFVGREKELAELQHRLNAAIAGECQFILLGGEAGIGKSRLLEELENLAKARNISVLHGRFVEIDHALPYQGYCETIQEYFRAKSPSVTPTDFSDLASDLVALFPVLAEVKELGSSSEDSIKPLSEAGAKKFEDRTYIFELLARTLTRMSGGKPLLLLFEDLHAADVSLEALDYIVRRLAPTPIFLSGTYRTTEVDKRHRLTKLLAGFKGDRRFAHVTLGPLSPSSHRSYLEQLTGSTGVDDRLAEKLYEATEGNPYFTSELARSLMDSGGIIKDDSGLCMLSSETAISSEELPVTIQQTIEERIERLPDDQREILSIASVLGRTFEFSDLETLAAEQENLESGIDQLLLSGFIEEDRQSRGDRLTFSSGVVRDVLYASLPRRKRRSLHKKYAEELESRNKGRLERVYAQLFDHYVQGDLPEKVIEYGFLLARKSLSAFSPEDTTRVIETILDFLEDDAESRPARAEAKMLLSSAHQMNGNTTAAMKELEDAIHIFEKQGQTDRLLAAIISAVEIAWRSLKIAETKRWVEKGLQVGRQVGDHASLARLLSVAATVANLRGEYKEAQEFLEEAETLKPAKTEVPPAAYQGGTVVIGLANACEARHPANIFLNEDAEVLANVFETLVTTDALGNLVPNLCERWETLNEGSLFLFVLRKEVRLHDESSLTAVEVKTSLEHAVRRAGQNMSPAFTAIKGVDEFLKSHSDQISGVVALSENIIEIQLKEILPIYPALLTDMRTAIAVQRQDSPEFLGTGPFRIQDISLQAVVLVKNEKYWKNNPPALDRLEFRVAGSSSEVAEGFRNGTFDLVRDLLPHDLEGILRDRSLRPNFAEIPQKNVYFMMFNTSRVFGQNSKLRRAVAGLSNMHDLVRTTLGRFAQPAENLLPPGILGHYPGRRRSALTLEQARKLVEESEIDLPIRFSTSVHPIYLDRYSSLLNSLFLNWKEIGIEVDIKTPSLEQYKPSWENNEELDFLIARWYPDYDDPDSFTYALFHSQIGELRKYYSSRDLDQLMEQARLERDPVEREKLYRKVEDHLIDLHVFIPLFHDIDYRIAGPKVRHLSLLNTAPFVNYQSLQKTGIEPESPSLKVDRGRIVVPMTGILENLDPSRAVTQEESTVIPAIYETLTVVAEGARIIPWLAASFRAEKGGKRFHFRLRDGIRFHDGRRLTSRDVRYSFERLLQNRHSVMRWLLSPISGAQKLLSSDQPQELEGFHILSSLEFFIELDQPLSFFPATLAYLPAAIIPEGTDPSGHSWQQGAIGTGPFRLIHFEPGKYIKAEANPDYWRPEFPKTDLLECYFGVPVQEVVSGFRGRRYSLAFNLDPSSVESLLREPEYSKGFREIGSLSTNYMMFNANAGPLADEETRRRLVQAIDVDRLVRRNVGRLAVVAKTLIPPALLGYEPAAYSAYSAQQKKSFSQPVELKVGLHTVYNGPYQALTHELFRTLSENGFLVKVLPASAEHLALEGKSSDIDVVISRWYPDYPDPDTFTHGLLHTKWGIYGKISGTAEIDRLIEKARTETALPARHAIYREVEEIIQKKAIVLPLFHEQSYCFGRPEIEGLELNIFNYIIPFEKLRIRR